MQYTTNYNLKKPEGTDPVLIGDINDNSDIIDAALESKITEPSEDGADGQVLTTDGNGGRSWTTVQGGGGSVEIKNGTDLVIAEGTSGPTISGLSLGDTIRVDESVTPGSTSYVNYYVVEKKSAAVVLMRSTSNSLGTRSSGGKYEDSQWDTWLNNSADGFLSRFKSAISNVINPVIITYKNGNTAAIATISRGVFLPTQYQLDDTQANVESETSYMPTLRLIMPTLSDIAIRNALKGANSSGGYVRTPNGSSAKMWVWNGNSNYWSDASDNRYAIGVCMAIKNSALISTEDNVHTLVGMPTPAYVGTVDKIQDRNDYYKIADQRIPSTSSLADGNYKLRVSMASGVPTFSWVSDT